MGVGPCDRVLGGRASARPLERRSRGAAVTRRSPAARPAAGRSTTSRGTSQAGTLAPATRRPFGRSAATLTLREPARTERSKHNRDMVFDWDKAATILADRGATDAGAYLESDYKATWRPILADGQPAPTEYVWLASGWGPPTLEISGETGVPCWRWLDETSWDGSTYWPASALAILRGAVATETREHGR